MKLTEILARFDRVSPRLDTAKGWMARCPAHDDKTPSLAIKEDGDRILIHCFAGCDPKDVMAAIGLTLADLYRDGPSYRPSITNQDIKTLIREMHLLEIALGDRINGRIEQVEKNRQREILAVRRIIKSLYSLYGSELKKNGVHRRPDNNHQPTTN